MKHKVSIENTKRNRTILENSALLRGKYKIQTEEVDENIHISLEATEAAFANFTRVLLNSGMNYRRILA